MWQPQNAHVTAAPRRLPFARSGQLRPATLLRPSMLRAIFRFYRIAEPVSACHASRLGSSSQSIGFNTQLRIPGQVGHDGSRCRVLTDAMRDVAPCI